MKRALQHILMILISLCLLSTSQAKAPIATNQNYIETINKKNGLNINSLRDVFAFVFNQLPNEVTVYPTENYYYYSFHHDGTKFSGNIRLDALDRDKGIAHFAYFSTYNRWNDELLNNYKPLGIADGLKVKKLAPLRYKLTYGKKSVIFNLNNLANIKPPMDKIRKDEKYLGPVYDESGIQFYLVYNPKIKKFHYILNDSQTVPDTLTPSAISKDVFIGTRTGFAYHRDHHKNRLILIGIYDGNSMVNNYFDGPFDQLPDNFIKGDSLKNAFIHQSPDLKGKIDRYGNTDGGSSRVLITPYIHYGHENQLEIFTNCIAKAGNDKKAYYSCLSQSDPDM